jgi:hypothetical protein
LQIVSIVDAQSSSQFFGDEGVRMHDLLTGLGCIGDIGCALHDFTPTTACGYNPSAMQCDNSGQVSHL